MTTTRRLAAIMAADVAGFSAAMERDEEGTYARVQELRRSIVEPKIAEHQGRLIKTTGDGFLAEFASPIAATRCALAIQGELAGAPLKLRIGLNLGDIIVEESGDVYGEGVNIAARLEALADAGGILISAKVFGEVEGKIDASFADRGEQQVKNIARPVRAYAVSTGVATPATVATDNKPLPLPDKPSIAVLPFQNMSGDPEQEYFADGIVEDIITALSRFRSLFVIARNSSFTYKGKAVDIKQVGRELGVRYVLQGSVRKAGARVRITGQLIEAANNNHLWAEKFDGELTDVFELQDKVTSSVVASIGPKLERAEIDRAKRKSTEELGSYDCFLRGMALNYKGLHSDACALFKEAFTLDPEFAAAYAMAAISIMVPPSAGGLSPEARSDAIRYAQLAARLGSEDALAMARAAQVLAFVGHEYEQAETLVEQAVALNSNLGAVWFSRGWVSLNCGKPDRALESFEHLLRLSPLDPLTKNVRYGMACAYHGLGRYAEGCSSAMEAIRRRAEVHTLGSFVMNAVPAGRKAEARDAVHQLLRLRPNFRASSVSQVFPTRDAEWSHKMVAAFREAGLPE